MLACRRSAEQETLNKLTKSCASTSPILRADRQLPCEQARLRSTETELHMTALQLRAAAIGTCGDARTLSGWGQAIKVFTVSSLCAASKGIVQPLPEDAPAQAPDDAQ